jgi:hypothetical protein
MISYDQGLGKRNETPTLKKLDSCMAEDEAALTRW